MKNRGFVFHLCLLLFLCCGNAVKAQFNQLSMLGVDTDISIYKLGSEWTFAYQFIPPKAKLVSENTITTEDLNKVKNVVITAVKTPEHFREILDADNIADFSFEYKYPPQGISSQSMILENENMVWIHPPRSYFFKILQINPYPYIKKPFKKGTKWTWELEIGSFWGDKRWKEWTGIITNVANYEIVGDTLLSTKLGKMKCYVVQSSAKSELGTTYLTSYFNQTFGFVKLDYTNIDGSKIILELIEWKPKNSLSLPQPNQGFMDGIAAAYQPCAVSSTAWLSGVMR